MENYGTIVIPCHSDAFYESQSIFSMASKKDKNQRAMKTLFFNKFDNMANYFAHFDFTGPEIWN